MGAVSQLCTNGLLMKHGTIIKEGIIDHVINEYLKDYSVNKARILQKDNEQKPTQVLDLKFVDVHGNECNSFGHDEEISIIFTLKNTSKEKGIVCSLSLFDFHERIVFTEQMAIEDMGYLTYKVSLPKGLFRPNNYKFGIALHIPMIKVIEIPDQITFEIIDRGTQYSIYGNQDTGIIFPQLNWQRTKYLS